MSKKQAKQEKRADQPDRGSGGENVFDTEGAAQYLGLSPATLSTRRTRGGGPVFVKLGRSVRYLRRDLDAYLDAHRVRNTSAAAVSKI
jgi:predicted DNA-binding transcriptional regulator AlpA